MTFSIEITSVLVGCGLLSGALVRNWLALQILIKDNKANRNILTDIGKRVSRIERHLIKNLDFDKDTDSGFFNE